MIANRLTPVLAAAALVAAFTTMAEAGDRWGDRSPGKHRHHRVENSRWDRQGDGRWNRPAEIGRLTRFDRSPHFHRPSGFDGQRDWVSFVRGLGAYGGSIEAYQVRGNGIYFLRDDWPVQETTTVVLAPKAKIIHVDEDLRGAAGSACSYEAGVCVIRGGN